MAAGDEGDMDYLDLPDHDNIYDIHLGDHDDDHHHNDELAQDVDHDDHNDDANHNDDPINLDDHVDDQQQPFAPGHRDIIFIGDYCSGPDSSQDHEW